MGGGKAAIILQKNAERSTNFLQGHALYSRVNAKTHLARHCAPHPISYAEVAQQRRFLVAANTPSASTLPDRAARISTALRILRSLGRE